MSTPTSEDAFRDIPEKFKGFRKIYEDRISDELDRRELDRARRC